MALQGGGSGVHSAGRVLKASVSGVKAAMEPAVKRGVYPEHLLSQWNGMCG